MDQLKFVQEIWTGMVCLKAVFHKFCLDHSFKYFISYDFHARQIVIKDNLLLHIIFIMSVNLFWFVFTKVIT